MGRKILFLAPVNPMGVGGGSFATHAYLRAISSLFDGNVDVVMADSWSEKWDERITVNAYYKANPMTIKQYAFSIFTHEIQRYSRVAKKILKECPDDYYAIISNGSSISGKLYNYAIKKGIKLITIHHNCEPEYFAANSKGLHRLLYLPIVRNLEKKAYLNSDINLFLTEQDKDCFEKFYGESKGVNEYIGVFEFNDYYRSNYVVKANKHITFVITGSLCTMQGIDGIVYFFEELYQYLPKVCKVIIAGRDPANVIKAYCKKYSNVELIANPCDMSKVIASGDCYICPTRVGGGLKLRVMDGLKLGLPVIAHECSARGYDSFWGTPYFYKFKNPLEFKDSVELMASKLVEIKREEVIGRYVSSFSYKAGSERMKNVLGKLLETKSNNLV